MFDQLSFLSFFLSLSSLFPFISFFFCFVFLFAFLCSLFFFFLFFFLSFLLYFMNRNIFSKKNNLFLTMIFFLYKCLAYLGKRKKIFYLTQLYEKRCVFWLPRTWLSLICFMLVAASRRHKNLMFLNPQKQPYSSFKINLGQMDGPSDGSMDRWTDRRTDRTS